MELTTYSPDRYLPDEPDIVLGRSIALLSLGSIIQELFAGYVGLLGVGEGQDQTADAEQSG
jgi:hypothetical protein